MLPQIITGNFVVIKDPALHGRFIKRVLDSYFLRAAGTQKLISEHVVYMDTKYLLAKTHQLNIEEDDYDYVSEMELLHFDTHVFTPVMYDIMAVLNHHHISYFSEELNRLKNMPWKQVW